MISNISNYNKFNELFIQIKYIEYDCAASIPQTLNSDCQVCSKLANLTGYEQLKKQGADCNLFAIKKKKRKNYSQSKIQITLFHNSRIRFSVELPHR